MAGRKRKFPFGYVIPHSNVTSDDDVDDVDIADLSESRELRVGGRTEARESDPEESGDIPGSPANHEAHEEHGANADVGEEEDDRDLEEDDDSVPEREVPRQFQPQFPFNREENDQLPGEQFLLEPGRHHDFLEGVVEPDLQEMMSDDNNQEPNEPHDEDDVFDDRGHCK